MICRACPATQTPQICSMSDLKPAALPLKLPLWVSKTRLTYVELADLRRDMQSSSDWMRQELGRRKQDRYFRNTKANLTKAP
jgi:hypothetical protein